MLQAGCTPRILFTSTGTDKAVHRLKTAGIYDLVSHVLGGDQVTHGKPDPEIYLKAATKAGVIPIPEIIDRHVPDLSYRLL
jgi:beta-phosphoglucomutase-like phosphatase (HAD superfamily)